MKTKKKKRGAFLPGAPPGLPGREELGQEGGDGGSGLRISLRQYSGEALTEQSAEGLEELSLDGGGVDQILWLDVAGHPPAGFLKKLGEHFGLHPLLLEDLYKGGQRPKVEEGEVYLAVHLPRLLPSPEKLAESGARQAAAVLTPRGVLSFHEVGDPLWKPVAERLHTGNGLLRNRGADYLFYSLIDCLVDHAFPLLAELEDRVDGLEDLLMEAPDNPELLKGIHLLRSAMMPFRRVWHPLTEVLSALRGTEQTLLGENARLYLGDAEDHTRRVQDSLTGLRERLSGMMEYHLAMVSLGMNNVMKVLTIISTLFIPLTFVAGIYGMNFEYMPELSRPWAYPAVLGAMACMAGAMVVFFRRKRWL